MRAKVNGAELYFDVEGAGLVPDGPQMREKPVCFVLHGGPGMDHTYFKPYLSPLAEDMQLVCVDHRNTGRSERVSLESCTIEQMAHDLEALRHYLGLGKVRVDGGRPPLHGFCQRLQSEPERGSERPRAATCSPPPSSMREGLG